MVPPPDNMGEFPDFDSMTPEEQMAWLESLAKRQGVGDDELTTSADVEIGEVSADVIINEPGYVPFEGSRSAREMQKKTEAEAEAPVSELETVSEAEPELEWEPAESIEEMPDVVSEVLAEAEGDVSDSMQWLEDLSVQPEAEASDLEGMLTETEAMESEAALPSEEVLPEFDIAAASEEDLLGDMDPMLFLESLAKRQGANLEELTTAADMEVEDISADTVVDEPGYVPFEGSRSAREMKKEAESLASEPELIEDSVSLTDFEAEAQAAEGEEADLFEEVEFDLPELVEDTVIDEPGYVEFAPLDIQPSDVGADLPARESDLFESEAGEDALSWLEDLAAEPDEEFTDIFAEAEEVETVEAAEAEPAIITRPTAPPSEDLLEDMSDEDVARAQAKGQLTPEQELAWLNRQAAKLAQVRDSQEMDEVVDEASLEPAQPADLPPWLEQMRDQPEKEGAGIEEIELVESADLPVDLFEGVELDAEIDMSALALDTDEFSPADVDTLWAETTEEEPAETPEYPESELVAFLESDLEPEEDALAEALDAEFERKIAGDETEPEWYTEAVAKVAAEASEVPDTAPPGELEQPGTLPEPVVAEATPVDMPDWIQESGEEAPAVTDAMPAWLTGVEADVTDMPDWLAEPEVEAEVMPDWLGETGGEAVIEDAALAWTPETALEESVPAPEPVPPAPKPEPEPIASAISPPPPAPSSLPAAEIEPEVPVPVPAAVPAGELFETYRQRLEADPNDYPSRLALARALRNDQQLSPSLDQYETLVNATQLLQDIADDLTSLPAETSDMPRVRRLLGDTYMRQGKLQEALDAYRSALNQL